MVAVFSSLLGSTADTYLCQSTEAWGCVKVDLGSCGRFRFMFMRQSTFVFVRISHIFPSLCVGLLA